MLCAFASLRENKPKIQRDCFVPRNDKMEKVKAKKHLGQHFLKDESIAKDIADTLNLVGYEDVLEIGPGMGVLTKYLLDKPINTYVIEIDEESVDVFGC